MFPVSKMRQCICTLIQCTFFMTSQIQGTVRLGDKYNRIQYTSSDSLSLRVLCATRGRKHNDTVYSITCIKCDGRDLGGIS